MAVWMVWWGLVSDCVGHAARLCVWESSGSLVVAWDVYVCCYILRHC